MEKGDTGAEARFQSPKSLAFPVAIPLPMLCILLTVPLPLIMSQILPILVQILFH